MKPPMKNKDDSFEDEEMDLFLMSFLDEDYEFNPDEPDYWDGFSYPDEEAFLPQEPVNSQDQTIQVNQRPF